MIWIWFLDKRISLISNRHMVRSSNGCYCEIKRIKKHLWWRTIWPGASVATHLRPLLMDEYFRFVYRSIRWHQNIHAIRDNTFAARNNMCVAFEYCKRCRQADKSHINPKSSVNTDHLTTANIYDTPSTQSN